MAEEPRVPPLFIKKITIPGGFGLLSEIIPFSLTMSVVSAKLKCLEIGWFLGFCP